MIYLIESYNYYKIGYTTDISKRLILYKTCNPSFKLLDTYEDGTKLDETYLHRLLFPYRKYSEWFYKKPIIIKEWNNLTNHNVEYVNNELSKDNKFIINNFKEIYKLNSTNALKLFIWLCTHINTQNIVYLPADRRKLIQEELNISNNTLTNNLKLLKDNNLIKGGQGCFYIN